MAKAGKDADHRGSDRPPLMKRPEMNLTGEMETPAERLEVIADSPRRQRPAAHRTPNQPRQHKQQHHSGKGDAAGTGKKITHRPRRQQQDKVMAEGDQQPRQHHRQADTEIGTNHFPPRKRLRRLRCLTPPEFTVKKE